MGFITTLALAVAISLATPVPQAAEPQVVKMTAKKYEFSPGTVTVERGRPVRLEITALDHTHGLEIEALDLKVKCEKGKTAVLEFTPERAGEFPFRCSVFCGFGHGKMKGSLVVVEPKT